MDGLSGWWLGDGWNRMGETQRVLWAVMCLQGHAAHSIHVPTKSAASCRSFIAIPMIVARKLVPLLLHKDERRVNI